MRFRKPAEQVQWEIMSRAQTQAKYGLASAFGQAGYGNATGPIQDAVSSAIAMAVMEGFKVLMENEYTDADFERDLTLRD